MIRKSMSLTYEPSIASSVDLPHLRQQIRGFNARNPRSCEKSPARNPRRLRRMVLCFTHLLAKGPSAPCIESNTEKRRRLSISALPAASTCRTFPVSRRWGQDVEFCALHRVASTIRHSLPLGPYGRSMPRALWWSYRGGRFL